LNPLPENPELVPETLSSSAFDLAIGPLAEPAPATPQHPPWWDVFVLAVLTVVSVMLLFASMVAAVVITKEWIYPHLGMAEIVRMPLVAVFGEAAGYLLILPCMYLLVTRVRNLPDFLAAIHWNWPSKPGRHLFAGFVLSLALQGVAHLLPIPKNLPIDSFFRTSAEAWTLSIFGVTLAPLMEELYFRGFLYPVLDRLLGVAAAILKVDRRIGVAAAILLTAAPFALLHGSQLRFSWGPVLVILLVGVVLTAVRALTNSVAAGLLVHVAYNATISILMFVATDGFRHLERLNQ
jgi:membrane protease YdiL (CAAX protease family)